MRGQRKLWENVIVVMFLLIGVFATVLVGRYGTEGTLKGLAVVVGALWVISRAL